MSRIYPHANPNNPEAIEKIVSSLCYLSMGLAGLLYIIIQGRNSQSSFFRFNFLQSILLGIFCFLLQWTAQALFTVAKGILSLFGAAINNLDLVSLAAQSTALLSNFGYLFILYGCIWSLLGKPAEIPFVSRIARQQMR
jgi:uncharacterized membrane protein